MNRHIRTDPACTRHRSPRGRLSTWWFDRHRGRACPPCEAERAHRYNPETYRCTCGALDHPDWGVTA